MYPCLLAHCCDLHSAFEGSSGKGPFGLKVLNLGWGPLVDVLEGTKSFSGKTDPNMFGFQAEYLFHYKS